MHTSAVVIKLKSDSNKTKTDLAIKNPSEI
jgi:hypothetical protein